MNPWLETLFVSLLAVLGIVMGRGFSRLKRPYWPLGCLIPLALILSLILARYCGNLTSSPAMYWLLTGRVKFVIVCLAATVGLATPITHLRHKWEKVIVSVLMVAVVCFSILPFLCPALLRSRLSNLRTRFDCDGICVQTTSYTCGPAAAVTALGQLGLSANEGEIAVLSRTTPVTGTLPISLCSALQRRYGDDGLRCRYRQFESFDQLKDAGVTLAVVRDALMLDHCITVLEVTSGSITVADPVLGKRVMSRERFEDVWRFAGIVLTRDAEQHI